MFVLHSNGRWLFVCFSILHIVKNMYKTTDWVTEASCRATGVCSNPMFSFTTFGKEKKNKPKMLGFSLGLWWSSRLEMNSVSKTLPPSGRQCETEMNFGGLVGVCVVRRSIAPSSWFFLKDNGLLGKMGDTCWAWMTFAQQLIFSLAWKNKSLLFFYPEWRQTKG